MENGNWKIERRKKKEERRKKKEELVIVEAEAPTVSRKAKNPGRQGGVWGTRYTARRLGVP